MYDYTLHQKEYSLTKDELLTVTTNPPSSKEDWGNKAFDDIKQNFKKHIILMQYDRCAYCRKIVEVDAYYEPLEHIVPKSRKPEWLIEPRNLVITCNRCNNLKKDTQTLVDAYTDAKEMPEGSEAYKIFNPYFDKWSDHFCIVKEMFLEPVPNSKGKLTIEICKLDKFHVCVNIAKEKRLGQKKPIGKAIDRLRELDKNSDSYEEIFSELLNVIEHYKERMQENENYP